MTHNIAWHFTSDKLRDGTPIPAIGEKLVFNDDIEICRKGYHWSKEPFDAMKYAPGNTLHMVQYGGNIQEQEDKGCSSERTILKSIDAAYLLRRFAADQALSVSHLWDMPDIVKAYLTTLDETIRQAATAIAYRTAYYASASYAASDAASSAYYASAYYASASYAYRAATYAAVAAYYDFRGAAARKEFNHRVYKAFEGFNNV